MTRTATIANTANVKVPNGIKGEEVMVGDGEMKGLSHSVVGISWVAVGIGQQGRNTRLQILKT